jgi:uncharacterized protein involved in exopolysaccharide biosynthesis
MFDDDNISVFYFLNVIVQKWKFITLFVILSVPFSGLYYMLVTEVYESNSIIMVGKQHATDHVFIESPVILAKRINLQYRYMKDVDRISVKINPTSFYEVVQRTVELSLQSDSAEKAQKLLSALVNDLIEKHWYLYATQHMNDQTQDQLKSAIVLKPTYAEKVVNPIDYAIFINGAIFSLLIGCFIAVLLHHNSILRKIQS